MITKKSDTSESRSDLCTIDSIIFFVYGRIFCHFEKTADILIPNFEKK